MHRHLLRCPLPHTRPTTLTGGPSTSAAAPPGSSAPAAEQELEYSEAKAAVLLWERTFESKKGRPPAERERAASPTYRERLRRYKELRRLRRQMEEAPTAGAPPQPQGSEQRKMLAREYRKVRQWLALTLTLNLP